MKLSPLKALLLAAVAASTLAAPIIAAAQPNPDRAASREETQAERKARQDARQKQRTEAARQKAARQAADARVRPGRPGDAKLRPVPNRPNQPDRVRPDRPQRPQVRPAPDRPQTTAPTRRPLTRERLRVRRDAQTQIQRSFNRDRWQQDFRRRHSDRRWWRNHRHFRGWNGIRIGFYFAPGYGYYSVPRSYYNRRYYAGDYLPSFFWRYRVNDYNFWYLPPAPPGTAWIYVNNAILLVDLWDGYIITAIYDVWYW